jgi:hypothetical protein
VSRMCRKWLKTSYLAHTVAICIQFSIYYRCALRARVPTSAKTVTPLVARVLEFAARVVLLAVKRPAAERACPVPFRGFRRCSGSRGALAHGGNPPASQARRLHRKVIASVVAGAPR